MEFLYGELILNVRSALVFASTFLLLLGWLRWRAVYGSLPPGPRSASPLGSRQLFSPRMHLELAALGRAYGGVFTLRMGLQPIVVLSGPEAIREALVRMADDFSDRFTFPFGEKTFKLEGSLLFANGAPWVARRRAALSALRTLGMGKTSLEARVAEEARYLCDALDGRAAAAAGRPFDPARTVNSAVANIICTLSFGQRYDYADPAYESLLADLDTFFRASPMETIMWGLPGARALARFRRIGDAFEALAAFSRRMVESHRATFDPDNVRDLIDSFLLEGDRQRAAGHELGVAVFRDDLVWRVVHDLFAAGTDTTTNTVLWLILLMMEYPDVQKRVQREVDDVIGDGRSPAMSDRVRMPYTEATLMEVQRHRTVAPYVPPRAVRGDVRILGHTLTAGTQIWVDLWGALNDPAHWSHPDTFDPSRFLSDDEQHVVIPEAFIPFGAGKRTCIGEQLAKMELFIFFTSMMQRFTFTPEGNTPLNMNGKIGITLVPHPYKTVAVRR